MRGTSPLIAASSHKTKICIHIHPIDCLIIPVFVSFCRNMQLSKFLIDDPPTPFFVVARSTGQSWYFKLKIQTLWIWGWFFFQWCDKYHLTVFFILKFQVPFRWKNVHMHRFFGIGYIYSQFKLLTSPQAPPDYRVWWVFLLDECFISICFFSNGRCQVVTTVTGPSNSSGFLSKEEYTIRWFIDVDELVWIWQNGVMIYIWLIKFYFGRVWSNLLISTRMAGLFLSLLHTFFVIKMSWLFCCYVPFDIKALFNFHPITWLSP